MDYIACLFLLVLSCRWMGRMREYRMGLRLAKKPLAPIDTHFQDDIVNEGQNVTFASEDYGHILDLIWPGMQNLIKFCCDNASIYIIYLCTCN